MTHQHLSICSRSQRRDPTLPAFWFSALQHADTDDAQCIAHRLQWEPAQ